MGKKLKIRRRKLNETASYTQVFAMEEEDDTLTVAEALEQLNSRDNLETVDGKPADPIRFEQSCRQKKCGACAMLIQGVPRLACSTKLSDFKEETVELAPLRKFPVVVDLIVDRSVIPENLKTMRVWLEDDMEIFDTEREDIYDSARCLMCGCCLEVCPNFMVGDTFFGTVGMLASSRILLDVPAVQRKELSKEYKRHIYSGCGKSLSCQDICPAEINIERLLARANARAVWNRNS